MSVNCCSNGFGKGINFREQLIWHCTVNPTKMHCDIAVTILGEKFKTCCHKPTSICVNHALETDLGWIIVFWGFGGFGLAGVGNPCMCVYLLQNIFDTASVSDGTPCYIMTGLIPGLHPANERRHYKVTPSLIGRAKTKNQPCNGGTRLNITGITLSTDAQTYPR